MDDFSAEFTKRLRELIADFDPKSDRAFARRAGIGPTNLQNYLNGALPRADKAAQIADATGVSIEWLITGRGEKYPRSSSVAAPGNAEADFEFIPRLDIHASAGTGSLAVHEETVDFLAFRSEWLRKVGINPQAARVLTARGDSMEPTIRDGDILLLDTSINRIIDNAIYVVVYSGLVLLKRVQVKLDGSVVLSSDNSAVYVPEVVQPSEVESLHVAARLMWFGRSI